MRVANSFGFWLAMVLGGAVLAGCATQAGTGGSAASALRADTRAVNEALEAVDPEGRYYVEFRARSYGVTGHTYMVYGRTEDEGKPASSYIVGLTPQGGAAGFAAGSVAAMPGTLDPSPADFSVKPLVTYRRAVTPEQYRKLIAFVAEQRGESHIWNLYVNNCNHFVGEAARAMGLSAPLVATVPPAAFVNELRALNENEGGSSV